MDKAKIETAVLMILEAIGEDPAREGLRDTPARVARMYEEIFSGLHTNPCKHMSAVFKENYNEIVLIRDIAFHSMCEHHLMPFIGKAHVAYVPAGRVLGISKFARVVEEFARRPQVQERLTSQVADLIMGELNPHGVAVIMDASHACMTLRGIKKPGASVVTSALRGIFLEDGASRTEVLSLLHRTV